ncbi:S-layer homology domain-containing protein [Oscillatoria sp. FACHB-1406]|uniref:S-layer homology domain-containing protein n=1 Tax=Oscillatoria sp. FACHB-1406 TaxID=2692846 RepID=UPI001682EF13|nr:S-layer homology domain-containing protein [Oscillatoria sp. FACHB-1406]MBD2579079.1 S-layer homology domain-containing protein [Oscillatoria sp. FACHB-1406]
MLKLNRWKATTALVLTASMNATAIAPLVAPMLAPAPAMAQSTGFRDVSDSYWAADFIQQLVQRGVIAGFPDGTFRPDAPVTRAQYSAMLRKAFNKGKIRDKVSFVDVPSTYWAMSAIDEAYEMGFLSGYPGRIFQPEQNIPREQVLVSLANGLNYTTTRTVNETLSYYNDFSSISSYARSPIAAATEKNMVVNYPILKTLNPVRNATRAEVAAFLYQALVSQNSASAIASNYIVSLSPIVTDFRIPAGTSIPVTYERDKIVLMQEETVQVELVVATNITTSDGTLLIPKGSKVLGELRPATGGTQFVSKEIVFANGTRKAFNATSQVITQTETVRQGSSLVNLLKNAAIGSAAAAAISGVTGDRTITASEVLIGTGAGLLASLVQRLIGAGSVDVLVVEPNTDLNLTLRSDFVVSPQ